MVESKEEGDEDEDNGEDFMWEEKLWIITYEPPKSSFTSLSKSSHVSVFKWEEAERSNI